VKTQVTDDNDAFRDFVKYGEGSTSVNRIDTGGSQPPAQTCGNGKYEGRSNKAASAAGNRVRGDSRALTDTNYRGMFRSMPGSAAVRIADDRSVGKRC
jgi:hypothetical protein